MIAAFVKYKNHNYYFYVTNSCYALTAPEEHNIGRKHQLPPPFSSVGAQYYAPMGLTDVRVFNFFKSINGRYDL